MAPELEPTDVWSFFFFFFFVVVVVEVVLLDVLVVLVDVLVDVLVAFLVALPIVAAEVVVPAVLLLFVWFVRDSVVVVVVRTVAGAVVVVVEICVVLALHMDAVGVGLDEPMGPGETPWRFKFMTQQSMTPLATELSCCTAISEAARTLHTAGWRFK